MLNDVPTARAGRRRRGPRRPKHGHGQLRLARRARRQVHRHAGAQLAPGVATTLGIEPTDLGPPDTGVPVAFGILTTDTNVFLKKAYFRYAVSLDEVRYVRSTQIPGDAKASRVDLITREDNHEWHFGPDVDTHDVDALAAILAESMTLPELERQDLRRRYGPIEAPMKDPGTPGSDSAEAGVSAPPTHTPTPDV